MIMIFSFICLFPVLYPIYGHIFVLLEDEPKDEDKPSPLAMLTAMNPQLSHMNKMINRHQGQISIID